MQKIQDKNTQIKNADVNDSKNNNVLQKLTHHVGDTSDDKSIIKPTSTSELDSNDNSKSENSDSTNQVVTPVTISDEKDTDISKGSQKQQEYPNVYWLKEGETFRQTLQRWAKRNDYKVIFEINYDFTIMQTTKLRGLFLSDSGPLMILLESLRSTTNPVKAVVTANKVILIRSDQYNVNMLSVNR